MTNNLGTTSLKRSRRAARPMQEFDRLPPVLRAWVAGAALPWRAASVRAAYGRAFGRTGNADAALKELDRIEAALIAKDAARVWGRGYPDALVRAA